MALPNKTTGGAIADPSILAKYAFFHANGKVMGEGLFELNDSKVPSAHVMFGTDILKTKIPYVADQAALDAWMDANPGVLTKKVKLSLTVIPFTNGQAYYINDGGSWLKPLIGGQFALDTAGNPSTILDPILYRADGTTIIQPSDGVWWIDFYSGVVKFGEGFTPATMGWGTPQITCYVYTGQTVKDVIDGLGSGSIATQTEVDAIESAMGSVINDSGNYVPFTTTNYINANNSVSEDLTDLDAQVKVNTDNIATHETEITNAQAEIDKIEAAIGSTISAAGDYVARTGSAYLDGNTSISEDITDLDSAASSLQALADTHEASIGLNTDGTKPNYTSVNYIGATDTLVAAVEKLDTQAKTAETTSSNIQTEVDKIETAIGAAISAAGDYVAHTTSVYINGNVSITEDLLDLDSAAQTLQTLADTHETSIGLTATGTKPDFTSTNFISATDTIVSAINKLDTSLNSVSTSAGAELDATQAALGASIATDGTYVAHTTSNYINGNTTVTEDILDLDTKAKSLQDELDTTQATMGAAMAADGTYVAHTTSNYVNGNTSFTEDILDLDVQAKSLQDELDATQSALGAAISTTGTYVAHVGATYISGNASITADLLDLDTAATGLQTLADTHESAIGLNTDGTYTAPVSNYVAGSTSVLNAVTLLDTQVKANTDAIAANGTNLQTEVDKIETAIGAVISAAGDYVAHTTSNYINSNTTITEDLLDLDIKLKSTSDIADGALQRSGGTMTGNINMGSQLITDLAAPVNANDAANKAYVDAMASGLKIKDAVKVASTAFEDFALDGSDSQDNGDNTFIIDGVKLIAGTYRVLLKNQTIETENGIYSVVIAAGTGTAATATFTRALDADGTPTGEVASGMFVYVEEGTINGATGWALKTENPIILGTTELEFAQFSSAGLVQAGTGIKKVGNVLSIGLGAAIVELPTNEIGLDIFANKGLILTTDGTTSSGSDSAGKLAIKLEDGSLEFGAGGGLKVAGSATSSLQTELDTTQASLGAAIATDGTYVAHTTSTYINGNTTITADLLDLDTAVAGLQTLADTHETNIGLLADGTLGTWTSTSYLSAITIKGGIEQLDTAAAGLQTLLDTHESNIGLAADGTLAAWANSNYLTGATTIKAGIEQLDVAAAGLQTLADTHETSIGLNTDGSLGAWSSTNYLTANTVKGGIEQLDTALTNYVLKSQLNNTAFVYQAGSASTQHVVSHNLASTSIECTVWVLDPDDGKYKNDLVGIVIDDNNQITIELTEARTIRAVIRSAASLA